VRVPPLDVGPVGAGTKPLGGQLPDGFQHVEPWPGVGRVDLHEAVPGECIEQIERHVFREIGDSRGRLDRPPVSEDREGGEHVPLGVLEQPDAPFNGRPQCALTLGKVDRAGTQGVEAVSEPSEQSAWSQQSRTGCCKLDGERQTIETPADLRNGPRVVVGQCEVVANGLRSIDEQPNGR
jgi:hypothetical protein